MKYSVATFDYNIPQEWQTDLFHQQLFDLGFDTIDENKAYIPTETLRACRAELENLCDQTEGVLLVSIDDCPDENWNAVWEAEHPIQELPLGIRIIPHCAFGAGHHETTSMIINTLLDAHLTGKKVLDQGTGTGVLAIFAKRLGAAEVIAVDIDDKSVLNAQENADLNGEIIEVLLGDNPPQGQYDLIIANIHRNVLLAHLPAYAAYLVPGGEIWLSGFYKADCPVLIEKAQENGLHHIATQNNGEWYMLRLGK